MNRLIINLLTVGTFLAGNAEYLIAGVVDMIARDLQVPLAMAGQLVTVFALAYAIGPPILVTLTARINRKKVMLSALFLFIIGNLVALWSPNFTVLMVSRVLLGLSGGLYTVVAMSVLSKLVPPEKLGSAIGTLTIGISGSLVFGVPLGIVVSEWLGWQMAFAMLALLSLFTMTGIVRFIPDLSGGEAIPFKQQFSVLKNRKIVSGFFVTLFWIAGYVTAYTFVTPFLRETAHMNTSAISVTMFVLGVFAMIGSSLEGYGADRWGIPKTVFFSMSIHALVLIFLSILTATGMTAAILGRYGLVLHG
ncbi:MFS transporter [Bacillus gobiensis]|uniref:MFS transporter n=1 Tax=Bacillus gobiensis TaxID=1441095 RepID=UPI003D214392